MGHARYVVTCKQGPVTKQTPYSSSCLDAAIGYARGLIGKSQVSKSWVIDTEVEPIETVWSSVVDSYEGNKGSK